MRKLEIESVPGMEQLMIQDGKNELLIFRQNTDWVIQLKEYELPDGKAKLLNIWLKPADVAALREVIK